MTKLNALVEYVKAVGHMETASPSTIARAAQAAENKGPKKGVQYVTKDKLKAIAKPSTMSVQDIAKQPDFKAALAVQGFKVYDKITTIGIGYVGPDKTTAKRRAALCVKLQKIAKKYNSEATCNDINVHLNGSDHPRIVLAASYKDFLTATKRVLSDLSTKALEGYK